MAGVCADDPTFIQTCMRIQCPPTEGACTPGELGYTHMIVNPRGYLRFLLCAVSVVVVQILYWAERRWVRISGAMCHIIGRRITGPAASLGAVCGCCWQWWRCLALPSRCCKRNVFSVERILIYIQFGPTSANIFSRTSIQDVPIFLSGF